MSWVRNAAVWKMLQKYGLELLPGHQLPLSPLWALEQTAWSSLLQKEEQHLNTCMLKTNSGDQHAVSVKCSHAQDNTNISVYRLKATVELLKYKVYPTPAYDLLYICEILIHYQNLHQSNFHQLGSKCNQSCMEQNAQPSPIKQQRNTGWATIPSSFTKSSGTLCFMKYCSLNSFFSHNSNFLVLLSIDFCVIRTG